MAVTTTSCKHKNTVKDCTYNLTGKVYCLDCKMITSISSPEEIEANIHKANATLYDSLAALVLIFFAVFGTIKIIVDIIR